MIPNYLADLQLPSVFSPYTSSVDNFLLLSNKDEYIVDSKSAGVSGFVTPSFGQEEYVAEKYFEVQNPSARPFALLQIDNGLVSSRNVKKCDCAIANDSDLCLIEFKANATSSNPVTIERKYSEAIEQLISTLGIFNRIEDISAKRKVEAYICFRRGYPQNTSAQMNYRVEFLERTGGIPLSFDRVKILQ